MPNHGRVHALPTPIVEHPLVTCLDCHMREGGISLARAREVIALPLPRRWRSSIIGWIFGWGPQCQKGMRLPSIYKQRCGVKGAWEGV